MRKQLSSSRLLPLLGAGLACSMLSTAAQAGETTSFNLSNKSLRLNYQALQPQNSRMIDLGILHHTDNGQLMNLGFHALNQLSLGKLAVGARAYFWHTHSRSGGALALGGTFDAAVAHWGNPIGIAFSGYGAPEVTTFNKARNLVDLDGQLYYQLMPSARAHVGYRMTNINFASSTQTMDQTMYFGMSLHF